MSGGVAGCSAGVVRELVGSGTLGAQSRRVALMISTPSVAVLGSPTRTVPIAASLQRAGLGVRSITTRRAHRSPGTTSSSDLTVLTWPPPACIRCSNPRSMASTRERCTSGGTGGAHPWGPLSGLVSGLAQRAWPQRGVAPVHAVPPATSSPGLLPGWRSRPVRSSSTAAPISWARVGRGMPMTPA